MKTLSTLKGDKHQQDMAIHAFSERVGEAAKRRQP